MPPSTPRCVRRALGRHGLAESLRLAERLLLPTACLLCGAYSADDALVCGACRSRWHRLPSPLCARCGQPVLVLAADDHLDCRLCAGWDDALTRVRSAVWLEDGARGAVHRLKYEGWWRITESMAEAMRVLEPLTGDACLVAVPLAPKRLRHRGYNQSECLAAALARRMGIKAAPGLLARVRETPTQTALTPEGRAANVSGAFRARGLAAAARGGSGYFVLVDDVFTTGATLIAAARALRAAGAARVEAVTFARAPLPVT